MEKEKSTPPKHRKCGFCENFNADEQMCEVWESEVNATDKKCGDFIYKQPDNN